MAVFPERLKQIDNTSSSSSDFSLTGIGNFVNSLAGAAGKVLTGINTPSAGQVASAGNTGAAGTAGGSSFSTWLPFILIGGAVVALVVIVMAVRK